MTRLLRLLAAFAVVCIGIGFGGPAVHAQEGNGSGAPETPPGGPAIDDLVGCVAASKQLAVMFLIDESASLKLSDPDDSRVPAAQGALESLLSLATAEGGASPSVDIAFAAFSNEYRLIQDWTGATTENAPILRDSLASFADLKNGIDTDFVNALTAANDSLSDRSAQITASGGAPPCRAILLFTDGGYDLAVRESAADKDRLGTTKPYAPGIELTDKESVEAAEKKGREELCRDGGVADQLRENDVTMLTVALSGDVATVLQLPLAAATTGSATMPGREPYTCGTVTDQPTGAYLAASDVDVLVERFNEVGTRLAGGNPVPGEIGADGSRTFTLDQGLRRVQILALPPEAGATVRIEDPRGESVELTEAGVATLGDTPINARAVAGRGLTIDIDRPTAAEAWDGEWKVSIVDADGEAPGEGALLQVFVFSDLAVQVGQLRPWFRGQATDIEATLAAPEGVDVEELVTAADVTLVVRNPITGETLDAPLEGPPAGPYTGEFTVPDDLIANGVEVTVEARLTTSSDAELLSQSAPREVLVQRAEGSIQILPPSLKMPSLTGEGSTETEIILQPGAAGGCVWFGEVEVPSAPEGADPIELTIDGQPLPGKADCIEVPEGQATTITVKATPAARASGTVRGWVRVFELSKGQEEASSTDLLFRFDLSRGVDEARRLVLAVALLIGGIALPMAALFVINAISARFQTLDAVRGTALPVRVSQGSIFRSEGTTQRSFLVREADFESLAGLGTTRSFAFGGVRFRAKAARNPFGATIAMAAPEGGAEKLKGNAGSRVELDPGLSGSWIFLLDSSKTRRGPRGEAEGLLIAFIAEGDASAQIQKLLPDIQARLPKVAENLAALLRNVTPKAAKPSKAKAKGAAAGEGATADEGDVDEVEGAEVEALPADDHADAVAAVDVADELELSADDAPEDLGGDAPDAPAAPVGFGGAPSSAPPPLPRMPVDEPDDDGPAAPPTGFTGGGR